MFDGTKAEIVYLTIVISCIMMEIFITFSWKGFFISVILMLMTIAWTISYLKEKNHA